MSGTEEGCSLPLLSVKYGPGQPGVLTTFYACDGHGTPDPSKGYGRSDDPPNPHEFYLCKEPLLNKQGLFTVYRTKE